MVSISSGSTPQPDVTCSNQLPSAMQVTHATVLVNHPPTVSKRVRASDSDSDEDDGRLAYIHLTNYIGWTMTQERFESQFGRASVKNPFGKYVWDGLANGYPMYVQMLGKDWLRTMHVWLGGVKMPEEFTKANAKLPSSIDHRSTVAASQYLYPALLFLDIRQHIKALDAMTHSEGPTILCTANGEPAAEPEAEPAAGSTTADGSHHVRFFQIDPRWMGSVYMVCLKIMITVSKPWEVHFDRVHLYCRLD
jgi:hypothetical protein